MSPYDPSKDLRLSERASVEVPVRIQMDAFQRPLSGLTANVSMLGMFLETFKPPPIGALIKFEMDLGPDERAVRGVGEVIWIRLEDGGPNAPAGMGIKFGHLSEASRAALEARLRRELESAEPEPS